MGSGLTTIVILRAISRVPRPASSTTSACANAAVGIVCACGHAWAFRRSSQLAGAGAVACARRGAEHAGDGSGQPDHRSADGLPGDGHGPGDRRGAARAHRRLGPGSAAPSRRDAGDAGSGRIAGAVIFLARALVPVRTADRRLSVVGRSRCSGRQVPGRRSAGFHGPASDDGGSDQGARGDQHQAAGAASRRPHPVSCRGSCWLAPRGAFLGYPAGFEKPVIIAVEIASMISITLALVMLVLGPPAGSAIVMTGIDHFRAGRSKPRRPRTLWRHHARERPASHPGLQHPRRRHLHRVRLCGSPWGRGRVCSPIPFRRRWSSPASSSRSLQRRWRRRSWFGLPPHGRRNSTPLPIRRIDG